MWSLWFLQSAIIIIIIIIKSTRECSIKGRGTRRRSSASTLFFFFLVPPWSVFCLLWERGSLKTGEEGGRTFTGLDFVLEGRDHQLESLPRGHQQSYQCITQLLARLIGVHDCHQRTGHEKVVFHQQLFVHREHKTETTTTTTTSESFFISGKKKEREGKTDTGEGLDVGNGKVIESRPLGAHPFSASLASLQL